MQRCQRASGRYSAALSDNPRQASEMMSCTPLRPRSTSVARREEFCDSRGIQNQAGEGAARGTKPQCWCRAQLLQQLKYRTIDQVAVSRVTSASASAYRNAPGCSFSNVDTINE